jgi:hypothetical protein
MADINTNTGSTLLLENDNFEPPELDLTVVDDLSELNTLNFDPLSALALLVAEYQRRLKYRTLCHSLGLVVGKTVTSFSADNVAHLGFHPDGSEKTLWEGMEIVYLTEDAPGHVRNYCVSGPDNGHLDEQTASGFGAQATEKGLARGSFRTKHYVEIFPHPYIFLG